MADTMTSVSIIYQLNTPRDVITYSSCCYRMSRGFISHSGGNYLLYQLDTWRHIYKGGFGTMRTFSSEIRSGIDSVNNTCSLMSCKRTSLFTFAHFNLLLKNT